MPLDRQLVVATSSNAVSDLSSDRCLALHAEQLHKQRLVEREKHHHKQLWTKDSHGGPYRKAESQGQPQQKPNPGYERPKSGPTTNFVGNHMTQGAIDLAQAELSTPAESALLLLQHEPYLGPRLLDAQPVSTKNPMLQAIAKYTWWDSKASVHICIPIGADISAEKLIPGQVQCSIQQQQLHCTITASTGHRVIQHKLSIPHLHAAIQPGLSTCLLDGQPVLLDQNTTPPVPSCSQTHHPALQYAEDTNRGALLKQCKPMPPSSPQAHNSPSAAYQQSPPSCRTSSMASHLQPPALSAATAAACASQVLITLTKADPSQVWEKLTRPLPVCQPCKLKPPSEQSMAALRRSLIHQRQQTQAQQGKPIACTAAALGLPAANSTQAAVGPDEHALQPSRLTAALDSRSHHLPAALAAAGASPGCNSATQETLAESVQGAQKQAEAQEEAGAYAEAAASYRVLLQGSALVGDDKLVTQGRMAWCFLQTGQAKAAVKEYSTLIDHLLFEVTGCLSQSQIKLLGAVLHQRASIYEQLEAYEASLQDFCQLQKLHPSDALAQQGACRLRSLTRHMLTSNSTKQA